MSNSRSRKYLLTINNPLLYDLTHDNIKSNMMSINCEYWCMCDEIGLENKTPHTHLFFYCENAISFNRVKKLFPSAHIDKALGSCQENRDYIRKEGKYQDSEKKDTNLIETFEEFGNVPIETKKANEKISVAVYQMLLDGKDNLEIIDAYPSYINKIPHLDKARETILLYKYKDLRLPKEVVYIYGPSRCGKTRFVMDTFGYNNVYRVSNYKNPFDKYSGQDVLLLDEFNSKIDFEMFLELTDDYPVTLSARYSDKVACYTKVFVISNKPFEKQYEYVGNEQWVAFCRRFSSIYKFDVGKNNFDSADKSEPSEFENREVSYV